MKPNSHLYAFCEIFILCTMHLLRTWNCKCTSISTADPGFFVRGGLGPSDKNLWQCCCFYLIPWKSQSFQANIQCCAIIVWIHACIEHESKLLLVLRSNSGQVWIYFIFKPFKDRLGRWQPSNLSPANFTQKLADIELIIYVHPAINLNNIHGRSLKVNSQPTRAVCW